MLLPLREFAYRSPQRDECVQKCSLVASGVSRLTRRMQVSPGQPPERDGWPSSHQPPWMMHTWRPIVSANVKRLSLLSPDATVRLDEAGLTILLSVGRAFRSQRKVKLEARIARAS